MKTKIALTSMLALFVAAPAFADPVSAEWPNDDYMTENKVYANAATDTHMDGVSDGTVNANAEYTDDLYTIPAGKYLAAATEGNSASDFTDCTAGNFCGGMSNVLYDANNAQGLTSCATVGDGSYVNSAVGSSVNTECYKACTVAVANIAHATAVDGNDYYGAGTDTCGATECATGYHVNWGADLPGLIGNAAATSSGVRNTNGTYTGDAALNESVGSETFVIWYGQDAMLTGGVFCGQPGSSQGAFISDENYESIATEGGGCWCRITDIQRRVNGYMIPSDTISTGWVFNQTYTGVEACANSCGTSCMELMTSTTSSDLAFRNALFATVPVTYSTCEANVIMINWTDATQEDIDANDAGYTVYDGDVRTPVKAVDKPGKTFRGWKFEKPASDTDTAGEMIQAGQNGNNGGLDLLG